MKDTFIYAFIRYLYHRVTKQKSWRVFWLSPHYAEFGLKRGHWLVSPRRTRSEAKLYTNGIFAHIYFDPGPADYGIKEPEYPPIADSRYSTPVGSDDIAHYHYKYKSTLWGK